MLLGCAGTNTYIPILRTQQRTDPYSFSRDGEQGTPWARTANSASPYSYNSQAYLDEEYLIIHRALRPLLRERTPPRLPPLPVRSRFDQRVRRRPSRGAPLRRWEGC